MDSFLAAAVIPTILFGVFNGALVSALVPIFSEFVARGDEDGAWRLASTVFNGLLLALSAFALCGWLLAPFYVPHHRAGFPGPQLGDDDRNDALADADHRGHEFGGRGERDAQRAPPLLGAAVQGMALNVVTIAAVVVLERRLGIYALVLGTTLGLFAQLLVQLPAVLRHRMYRLTLDLRHPGLHKIGAMLGPIVVGSAAGQMALFFDRLLRFDARRRQHLRHELRDEARGLPAADLCGGDCDGDLPAARLAIRDGQPQRRPAQRRDGPATRELHHDPVGLRLDLPRAPDRRGALSARTVRTGRDRVDLEPASVLRARARGRWQPTSC